MKAITVGFSLVILMLASLSAGIAQEPGRWYGARLMLDVGSKADPATVLRLEQSYEFAAVVMENGSRFPLTVEYMWHRAAGGGGDQFVYSRPVQVNEGVLTLTADVVTRLSPANAAGGVYGASTAASGGLTTSTVVDVIDAVTGVQLGLGKPLQSYLATGSGAASQSLDRIAIDMRPYRGHIVRLRMRPAVSEGSVWSPVGGPRFDVTRPERPPVVVVEEIGAGGSQSPVDVPEMRTPMIR